ncbi:MAG: sugar ABC transporter permease [Oscillospiraceae bacterium]|nr:sugar ABC transporter permease [Oscillospiraceae bacterium]
MFILLWFVGFLIFRLYPFASSLYYSFTDFNLLRHMTSTHNAVGFDNYAFVFTDDIPLRSLGITFMYSFVTVPLKLIVSLFVAYILNYKLKGVNLFRTAYYIPSILGGSIAIAVLWKAMFSNEGVINTIMGAVGLAPYNWLGESDTAVFIISALRIWQFGSAMVLFLAALKGVSLDLYEAATIDGASKVRQFFSITVPLITPIIFYNLITQVVQAFQEFNGPFIITNGGPDGATTLIALLIYNNAFRQYDMGMASAMAWVLFLIVAILSIVAFVSQKKWVYYDDVK